jgi:hypothetical protein
MELALSLPNQAQQQDGHILLTMLTMQQPEDALLVLDVILVEQRLEQRMEQLIELAINGPAVLVPLKAV